MQQLAAALYARSDEDLALEADDLETDFALWCEQHFNLDLNYVEITRILHERMDLKKRITE